jgi:hypothetical protein
MLHKTYFIIKNFFLMLIGGWLVICLPLLWLLGWNWSFVVWLLICPFCAVSGMKDDMASMEIESFRRAIERSNRF